MSGIIPPHNIEAEQALLGAILVNNRAFERVAEKLLPEHFAEGVHGRIYAAIAKLIERGTVANPVTLKNLFDQDGALAQIGGATYLAKLATGVVTIINARDYADTIMDLWQRRQIIEAASEAIAGAATAELDRDAEAVREELEAKLSTLHRIGTTAKGPHALHEFGAHAIQSAERAYKRQGKTTGVPTGLIDIDSMTGGLQPSDLILLAARPSMGKTALAVTIAVNAAAAGYPVFFASLEMSGEQVAARILSAKLRLSSQRMRTGALDAGDFQRMLDTNTNDLAALPMQVDETPGVTLATLRTRVRRFMGQAQKLPGAQVIDGQPAIPLVVIDYLQLMGSAGRRQQSRYEDVSDLSRGLKEIAKEFNVPVLALSQLSRAVEQRDNKRPQLSDLRDSGSLEQDADAVAFIFREEYYLSRDEPAQRPNETDEAFTKRRGIWEDRLEQVANTAEVIFAKQRHGPTGKATLRFDPETTSFDNFTRAGRWGYTPEPRGASMETA